MGIRNHHWEKKGKEKKRCDRARPHGILISHLICECSGPIRLKEKCQKKL